MNILVVSQHYYPENFRVTDICETLVRMGHNVTVICGYPNYPEGYIYEDYRGKNKKKHRHETINGVNVERCYEIPRGHNSFKLFLNYYSVCLSMRRKAKKIKEKYDIVFINETSPVMVGWAGIAYAKKNNVPCILYCYDIWPEALAAKGIKENSLIFKYYYRVSNKIYKNVDNILCTSNMFIDYFISKHNIDDKKLFYLPQYCEDLFSNYSIKKSVNNTFNYMFAGNVGNMQSVETIIKAANIIKNDDSIKVHIVGEGSSFEKCKQMVKKLELENVVFHGKHPIEEMPHYYSMADAMIVTLFKNKQISYTLPGKVQSYMAFGKPIIASIDGETQKVLDDAKCGLYTNAEDYVGLAKIFIDFKTSDSYQMAINAKKYYNDNFKKEIFFNKLIERMENLIK